MITQYDKPDFLVKHDTGESFGVEVTQLYNTESDSRLKNIPNYTRDLLHQKKYRHKKDINILKVENIVITKADGREIKTNAIIQESAKPFNYLAQVKDIIDTKSSLKKDYLSDLPHINLIINDNSDIFALTKPEEFYNRFFTPDIISSVTASSFKEIFLITQFEKNTVVIARLKFILLSSRIFLFHEIYKRHKVEDMTEDKYYNYLSEFLIFEGLKGVRIKKFHNETEIIYSNIGFIVKDSKDLVFRDYGDYQVNDGELVGAPNKRFITKEIENIISELKSSFGFSTNIGQQF